MLQQRGSLFSIAYFPPVSYFKACLSLEEIILESHEHFVKQTYRNRCHIYGANGLQKLIIPIEHKDLKTKTITDVICSNEEPWKNMHWRSITSAYRNSPYFDFYEDELSSLYLSDVNSLFEFNLNIINVLFSLLKISVNIRLSTEYKKIPDTPDLRNAFHPKLPVEHNFQNYHQVFADKHGFLPDLSILDLLCNMGPDTVVYLKNT